MTDERERELRRAVRTRDAFLAKLAMKLEERIASALANESERAKSLRGLADFAVELRIIAEPRRPVRVLPRRFELTRMILGMFDRGELSAGLAVESSPGKGAIVGRWDEAHLQTILAELVSNGLKYGRGHPVTIRASLRRSLAEIVVTNRGSWGGPAGPVERFRREEARPSIEGYGIGVWLGRRLARAHGGDLRFMNRDGETRAILRLPFDTAKGDLSGFYVRLAPT